VDSDTNYRTRSNQTGASCRWTKGHRESREVGELAGKVLRKAEFAPSLAYFCVADPDSYASKIWF